MILVGGDLHFRRRDLQESPQDTAHKITLI